MTKPVRKADPKDVCECGDYRRQHKNGTGRCCMPDDSCHGFKPCHQFRLAITAEQNARAG